MITSEIIYRRKPQREIMFVIYRYDVTYETGTDTKISDIAVF